MILKSLFAAICSLSFAQAFAQNCTPTKILPLGASITAGGYNINHNEWHVGGGWRQPLWKSLNQDGFNIDFVGSLADGPADFIDREHEGHSGWRVDEISAISDSVMQKYQPDLVMMIIGTNDVVQNFDLERADQRYEVLLQKVLNGMGPNGYVLAGSLITTNNLIFNSRLKKYNLAIQKVVNKYQRTNPRLIWVDMYSRSQIGMTTKDLTDGVHPTELGYQKMANVWYEDVSKLFQTTQLGCKF